MWNYRHYPAGIGARLCLMYASGKLYSRFPLFKGAWHKATLAYRASMFRTFCRYQGDILARHEREWRDGETVENAPVFVFWWQGLDGAPDIVKSCIASMRRHIGSHPLVVITRDNVWDYVDIPEYIYEKVERKIITQTQISDIQRIALLERYGGLWLDATIMDGISLADDLMLLAGATGELDSYSEEDLLTMDGYALPLALQLSSDKSVMLLYVLMRQGDKGYQPMLVLPLSKVSSLDFPKATGSHFSKTMRSTMSEVMDMAKTAELKLGSDGSDVLYNLFAVPLFNSNVSSTGKWNVEVTSGDTEFLERIFGGYMYSLMGSMTTGGGYEIWSYDGPSDPSMTYHYSLAYGDGATSGYANFNVTSSGEDPNEVTMMVQVSFRGLPVYEGTLRLTRDTSLSFMDVCEEMVASSSGPSTGYIELRSNGEVWFGYGETEAEGMNICVGTYGLDGGKIVIETASDLLPELEGLSISFGGLFGYSQSGDSAEIMILQQKNGADFGLKFNAVG